MTVVLTRIKYDMHISANVRWARTPGEEFVNGKYHRTHQWAFDGGATFLISSSPQIVAIPFSDPGHADPEETYVASIASCHMLFFLSLAARKNLIVESYEDAPSAILRKDHAGRMSIPAIILQPKIRFNGSPPQRSVVQALHDQAHHACFLANSIKTEITIQFDIL